MLKKTMLLFTAVAVIMVLALSACSGGWRESYEGFLDDLVGKVVDTNAVFITVFHAVQLIHQSIVEDGVKVQRANVIFVVLIAIGVTPEDAIQLAGQHLILHLADEELQLMPKRNICRHGCASFHKGLAKSYWDFCEVLHSVTGRFAPGRSFS